LVLRQDLPPRGSIAYLEPLQPLAPPEEDSGGLPALWQMVRGHRVGIALVAIAGAAVGLAISLLLTPIYEAKTTLIFQSTRVGDSIAGVSETDSGGLTAESYLQTQVRELKSRTLTKRVADKLLHQAPATYQAPDPIAKVRKLIGLPDVAAASAPKDLRLPPVDVQVKVLDNSRMVEINCESPDPRFAATYADTLAQEYIDYGMESLWQSAQKSSDWLTRQLQDMRTKLEQSETQLQTYTRDSGLIFTDKNQSVDDERLKQIQSELSTAQADRITKQSAYEIASTTPPEALPQVLDNGRLSEYQAKLADLRRQYAEQSTIYTPAYYKVRELQAQITDLENTLRRERTNIVSRIQNDYQAALKRERMLQTAFTQQMARVSDQSRKSIYYGMLKREVDTNRQVYDQLLQRAKQVGVAGALQPNNVRILDAAEIPRKPFKPDPLRNGLLGLASGFVIAVGFVLAGEFINRSVRVPGESAFHLRVPELGVIPAKAAVADQVLFPNVLTKAGAESQTKPKLELVTWQDRPSMLAEAYRNALTSILAANGKGRPKVILITSAGHSEGKSSTVSNLGIALAEINQRVLLIDADLRKPRLHDIFNLPNTWGLSDLLREKSSLRDCPIEALARKSEVDGLYVLPSGPGTVSITNLLYSSRMSELVDRVRTDFDITIIDTPPMSYLSDARVLGQLADAAILVIRSARTTRDEARAAKQRLVDDGIRVLGTILNAWEPKGKSSYGYGYGYGYYARKRS
jgi:capsular exopolysaccharide synthesis family protein